MKRSLKIIFLFTFIFFLGNIKTASAQQLLKDFFSTSEATFTYLGVDFTKARLINYPNPDAMDIRNRLFNSINDVVNDEPKKYDIAGAFHKTKVDADLSPVREKNSKVNAEEIVSTNTADFSRLKEADINTVVKASTFQAKKGVGLLFVMEGMLKEDKKGKASVWVVLIDLSSKKVLVAERFESKATGFGFRNYWASTIKETIDQVDDKKYKEWKKKFAE